MEHETTELFGLCGSQILHPQPCREVTNKVNMDTLNYNELQEVLHSMDVNTFNITLEEMEVTPDDMFEILVQAVSAFYVSSTLNKMAI